MSNGRSYRIYKDPRYDYLIVEIKRLENPKIKPFLTKGKTVCNSLQVNRSKTKAVLTTSIAIKEESIECLYFMMQAMNDCINSETLTNTKQ